MSETKVTGYLAPKDAACDIDAINDILETADMTTRPYYDSPDHYLEIAFYGWKVNAANLEKAFKNLAPYLDGGSVEVFDEKNDSYMRYSLGEDTETGFRVHSGSFDGWYYFPPLAPEDVSLIRSLLFEEMKHDEDPDLRRLYARM